MSDSWIVEMEYGASWDIHTGKHYPAERIASPTLTRKEAEKVASEHADCNPAIRPATQREIERDEFTKSVQKTIRQIPRTPLTANERMKDMDAPKWDPANFVPADQGKVVTPLRDELRAKVLAAYGIDENDPDWVALDEAIGPAEREATAQREHFEQVVIPARIAAVEADLTAQVQRYFGDVPESVQVTFERADRD